EQIAVLKRGPVELRILQRDGCRLSSYGVPGRAQRCAAVVLSRRTATAFRSIRLAPRSGGRARLLLRRGTLMTTDINRNAEEALGMLLDSELPLAARQNFLTG